MSKQASKLIEKAKHKILTGLKLNACTRANATLCQNDTYCCIDEGFQVMIEKKTQVKFLDQNYENRFTMKKQIAKANLIKPGNEISIEETVHNISELPMLVLTPEKKRNKVTSTFIEKESIATIMTEDLSLRSPSMSGINVLESLTHDSLLTNDSELNEYSSNAFTNQLYDSPVVTLSRHPDLTEDISRTFYSDIRPPSEEIYICCVSYKAQENGHLSIEFSDRLRLINSISNQEEFIIVQNVLTNQVGLVPKDSICTLAQFLDHVKQLKQKFS